ncbi:polyferredoxin [Desulfitispora alkaliphila]|uniref:hypothetical protein n=1 Tax=Desulfitispora alkaliphila TaxID=622674 RepID=UPI003D2192AA
MTVELLLGLGVIFTIMLGFGLSGMLTEKKRERRSWIWHKVVFLATGSVLSVVTFILMIIIVWPTKMVV